MPENKTILLVSEGLLGRRCALALGERAEVCVLGPGEDWPLLHGIAAIGLAAERPYPTIAERIDRAAFAHGIGWCSATILSHNGEVGPTVQPGQSACHACFSRRKLAQAANPMLNSIVDRMGAMTEGPWFSGRSPAFASQVAHLFAHEILHLVDGGAGGACWHLNAALGTTERHAVTAVAYCDRCTGDAARIAASNQSMKLWAGL